MTTIPGATKKKPGQLLPGQSDPQDERVSIVFRFTEGGATVIINDLIILGDPAAEHVYIDADGLSIRDSDTIYSSLSAGVLVLGRSDLDHVRVTATGIQLKDDTIVRGEWQTDGDIFIGSNLANPADTYLAIFATAQTYNSESMSAGDMLIGDNTTAKANILWDKSAGRLLFRGGPTTAAYIDSNGAITAAAGALTLDTNGLTIDQGIATATQIKFQDGANPILIIYATIDTNVASEGNLVVEGIDGDTPDAFLSLLAITHNGGRSAHLALDTANDRIQIDSSHLRVNGAGRYSGALVVGAAGSAAETTLHLAGPNAVTTIEETANTPANPAAGSQARIYVKADKLVVQFNDAATIRYKYLDLTGTGVTWIHTTTAP